MFVELKASYDEARNIGWVKELERAGAQVIYGLVGLKNHAKVALVVRREQGEIRRYAHVGTGNYNAGTARVYTDLGSAHRRPRHRRRPGRPVQPAHRHVRPAGRGPAPPAGGPGAPAARTARADRRARPSSPRRGGRAGSAPS